MASAAQQAANARYRASHLPLLREKSRQRRAAVRSGVPFRFQPEEDRQDWRSILQQAGISSADIAQACKLAYEEETLTGST
jgi:hypothetical protein